MSSWIFQVIIWAVLALAQLLLPLGLLRYGAKMRHLDRRTRYLTVIYGALTATWGISGALSIFAHRFPPTGEIAALLFDALAPTTAGQALVLERAFTQEKEDWSWSVAGWVWGAIVLILGAYSRLTGALPNVEQLLAAVGWIGLWSTLAFSWQRRHKQTEWAFRRNRALYWTWAAIWLVTGQALALFASRPLGALGLLLHLLGLTVITIAASRRYLPNVRAAIRGGLRFSILIVSLTVFFLFALWALSSFSQSPARAISSSPLAVLLAIVFAAAVALLYEPYRAFIIHVGQILIPRTGYHPEETLRQYSLAIGNIIDLDHLATVTLKTVNDTLEVQRAAVILVSEEERGICLRLLQGTGETSLGECPSTEILIDDDSPLIEHLAGGGKALFQHELAHETAFRNLVPRIREWLKDMGMEIYVPIFTQSTLLGILAVGPPRSGEPFSRQDQSFLSTLASQTGIALKNARMFADMRALNREITQLNEELQRAIKRAERLDRAKTDFLVIASHELRTPLTHVKGYADLLSELCNTRAVEREEIAGVVQSLAKGARQLETIVKAILDLSQIEEEKMVLYFAPTTLEAVMRMSLQSWLKPLRLRKIHLEIEGIDAIPPIVVDLQRLAQAFANLISNAIKYTPDGGKISIQARQVDAVHFKVSIIDTGIGIRPSDREIIFDKFFQTGDVNQHVSGTYRFMGGGPGLGLSIARGIIEAHGGRIWAVSEGYDETACPGSAFHVILPFEARREARRLVAPAGEEGDLPETKTSSSGAS
ncbi:MAG TPA: sensor histidine kinase [Chloroflexi bacterium]|nr:sensor histidine kinase [Chloroflexota bacterium]